MYLILGNWSIGDQKKCSTKTGPMPWAFSGEEPRARPFRRLRLWKCFAVRLRFDSTSQVPGADRNSGRRDFRWQIAVLSTAVDDSRSRQIESLRGSASHPSDRATQRNAAQPGGCIGEPSLLPHGHAADRKQEHRALPATRMWGFGLSSPGPTFETRSNQGLIVEWVNELPRRHFLPVSILSLYLYLGSRC
jgi:hypothetical protein